MLNVLITVAASGIGLGLTRRLARRGHCVTVSDINHADVLAVVAELKQAGLATRGALLDVTSAATIDSVLEDLRDDPPDVLINNAGIQYVAPLEQFPPAQWQSLIAVMLSGAAMMTRAVLPGMRARDFGRIVNIGSIHGLVASRYKSAYVAAKHGLIGFSKAIALETSDCNITINSVCPSYVMTPLVEAQIDALATTHKLPPDQVIRQIMLKPMPKGRFISLEELVGAVEFLMSDVARNITGQCLTIDGGWTAQ